MVRRAISLVLLAVAAGAGAEGPSLAVRAAGPALLEASNRQAVSLALICESADGDERPFDLVPVLPDGWKAIGGYGAFPLEPGVPEIRIVSFFVPAQAPAGEYPAVFELRDRADPAAVAECRLRVTVLPVVSFDLSVLEVPAFVLAGEEYESVFLLANSGNIGITVDLEVQCGQALPCRLVGLEDATAVPVPAGSRLPIRVAVQTRAGIPRSTRHPVRILARLHGDGRDAGPPPASATSIVEVIPLSLGNGSLMHTIPLTFLTAAGMTLSPGFDGFLEESISGSGTLDERGEHRVDLGIRTQLAAGEDPLVTSSDRYAIRYEQRLGEIRLGDHVYSLSPLLAMDRFGRGAGGTLVLNPVRLAAIFFKDVWSPAGRQGLGGGIDVTIPKHGSWDDFLYRAGLGALWPLADHAILGIWQQYRPLPRLALQLDTALDIGPAGVLSPAVLALAQGEAAGVSWNARALRAWPGFTGEHADTQSISAGARVRLLDDTLALDAAVSLTDKNLPLDAGRPAQRTVSLSLAAAGDIPVWDAEASLGYDLTRQLDRFPAPSYASWEHHVQAGWTQWLMPFTVSVVSSLTLNVDELTGTMLSTQKHLLSLGFDPSASAQYDLSLSWGRRRTNRLMPNDSVELNAGAVLLLAGGKLEGRLGNTWAYAATGLASVRFGLDAGFSHTFFWGHTLTLKGGVSLAYESLAWTPTGSLSASYGIPVDLPVSRKKDVSVVRGTVVRTETGTPQEGIVLRLNGLASATDRNGEFLFHVPRSGRLYLSMDPRTLASGVIPAQPTPVELTVAAGSETILDLAVVAGCTVTGTVTVYGYPQTSAVFEPQTAEGSTAPQLEKMGGLGNLVVQLSNGSEHTRRVTGTDGRFAFEEVLPGRWTLAVVAGQLPTYHSLEHGPVELDLAAGEAREIELKVIQEQRRIIMVDTGFAVVIENAEPSGDVMVTSAKGWASPTEEPDGEVVGETAATLAAPVTPEPEVPAPVASAEPAPAESAPAESEPAEPAAVTPPPLTSSEPVPAEPPPAESPPVEPVPAEPPPAEPGPDWRQLIAALQRRLMEPPVMFVTADAELAAAAETLTAGSAPAAPAPEAPAPAASPAAPPAATAPAATAPTVTVPSVPAAVTTSPGVTISIPLPMPTPQPPVTVPVPTPTPQPFWP